MTPQEVHGIVLDVLEQRDRQTVQVKLLDTYAGPREHVLTPAQPGDAGVDLYAAEEVVLLPGERAIVPTGVCIALPKGFEAQVRPRSGNAIKHGLTVLNSPGTVDEGYRGEVGVIVYNANPVVAMEVLDTLLDTLDVGLDPEDLVEEADLHVGESTLHIAKGQKVAQMVFARYARPEIEVVEALSSTKRGTEGFGSTGG
jgi:dUTP pyrophosphatase